MAIRIYLDNNVWDFLFERKLDLVRELPAPEFHILITREAEFEIPNSSERTALKEFIYKTIAQRGISTDSFFGFYAENLPRNEQRVGGFNFGRFADPKEIAFISQQRRLYGGLPKRPTKLYRNEADITLAARSFHSIVLTQDDKSGPLKNAKKQGGKVVSLKEYEKSGMTLKNFIMNAIMTS